MGGSSIFAGCPYYIEKGETKILTLGRVSKGHPNGYIMKIKRAKIEMDTMMPLLKLCGQ